MTFYFLGPALYIRRQINADRDTITGRFLARDVSNYETALIANPLSMAAIGSGIHNCSKP